MRIRHDYCDEAGDAIIASCIRETARGVWWLSAMCALPIWLPRFDRTLSEYSTWPFSGPKTLRLLELAKNPLHSTSPHIDLWFQSDDWSFRFGAFRALQLEGVSMERTHAMAHELRKQMDLFAVNDFMIAEGPWMDEFAVYDKRIEELDEFLSFGKHDG